MNVTLDVNGIVRFVKTRQQKNGGFSFAPPTPATLEDSFFAFSILSDLGRLSRDERLKSYPQMVQKMC